MKHLQISYQLVASLSVKWKKVSYHFNLFMFDAPNSSPFLFFNFFPYNKLVLIVWSSTGQIPSTFVERDQYQLHVHPHYELLKYMDCMQIHIVKIKMESKTLEVDTCTWNNRQENLKLQFCYIPLQSTWCTVVILQNFKANEAGCKKKKRLFWLELNGKIHVSLIDARLKSWMDL